MTDVVGAGDLLRFALALIFVIGLIAFLAFILKRYGGSFGYGPRPGAKRRLSLRETLPVDARHRLVLVRRDDREHLLLIGPQGSIVVESNIESGTDDDVAGEDLPPVGNMPSTRFQGLVRGMMQHRIRKSEDGPDQQ